MSEEEKKAIVYINKDLEKAIYLDLQIVNTDRFSIETILNPIEKQQKNNEELKNKLDIANKIIAEMVEYIDIEKMDFQCSSLCVRPGCEINCIQEYFRKKVEKC